jgi:L-malate glycosyltransferase
MAAARPVIAYDAGATSELVDAGSTGFLIPKLEYHKALPILKLLANDSNLRTGMGIKGREKARKLYHPDVFSARLNQIYDELLQENGSWSGRPRTCGSREKL